MGKIDELKLQEYTQKFLHLVQQQQSLIISSASAQNVPECSSAPYTRDSQGVFYILVSDMAAHSINMLENNMASILFVQPEAEVKDFFARERAIFNCTVCEIEKNGERFVEQLECLKQKFGGIVELISGFVDFHMLALTPVEGRYIAGFGQAFKINIAEDSLEFE